jgi:hypothetical protein
MRLPCAAAALLLASLVTAEPRERGEMLYRATLYRAAPGHLLELLDALRGPSAPSRSRMILRHSQGDHWDLMVLSHPSSVAAEIDDPGPPAEWVAWREDTFVKGPDLASQDTFWTAGLYHLEMFHALAGRRADLVHEREMENAYLLALDRPTNAIFVRVFGGSWDCFSVGPYRSWTHFAERDEIKAERSEAAARAAGFESATDIGPYLRSLILEHHDTLATPVR